jgi:hypothetical protein
MYGGCLRSCAGRHDKPGNSARLSKFSEWKVDKDGPDFVWNIIWLIVSRRTRRESDFQQRIMTTGLPLIMTAF